MLVCLCIVQCHLACVVFDQRTCASQGLATVQHLVLQLVMQSADSLHVQWALQYSAVRAKARPALGCLCSLLNTAILFLLPVQLLGQHQLLSR
jgi:hypothetical protein